MTPAYNSAYYGVSFRGKEVVPHGYALKNLEEPFANKSQTNRKYLAFAERAERDSYRAAARMLQSCREAETIHAHSHLRAMQGVGSTEEDLREGGE